MPNISLTESADRDQRVDEAYPWSTLQANEVRSLVRKFVDEVLEPAEAHVDRIADPAEAYRDPVFLDALEKAADLGLTGSTLPADWGGPGWSITTQMIAIEELAKGAPGFSSHILCACLAANAMIASRVWEDGPEYADYIRESVTRTRAVRGGAWAATEPTVGSDIFTFDRPEVGFATFAERTDDGWILRGSKSDYVSNGYLADYFLVMASVGDGSTMSESAAFLVPGDAPGVTRGAPLDKVGMRALNQAAVHFDSVHLPPEAMVVQPGEKYTRFLHRLTANGNTAVGFQSVGLAQRAYDHALAHVKSRKQGGKLLIEHPVVARTMFDARREIEAARALCYDTAAQIERRQMNVLNCYMARVQASSMSVRVVEQMVQMLGGYGIRKDGSPVERYYRDVKLMTIADGTVERISAVGGGLL